VTENVGFAGAGARAIAEALADVLVERGLVVERTAGPAARVLDVGQVADLLGRKPAWVYAHAAELGAFHFGDGPKARLGFADPLTGHGEGAFSDDNQLDRGRVRASGVLKRVGPRPRGCPHREHH
jgi:hypothetical protein